MVEENFMKAAVLDAANSPFRIAQVERPTPQAGQVLVRIRASGVNPLDTKIRTGGAPHAQHPLPAILGIDLAGIVEATGPGVTEFRPGDEVFGMTGGVGGLQGSLAEFAAVDARLLARKPAGISMREAAALPLAFITAWEGLVDRAAVQAGQKVLIQGAGGVGHVVAQLARAFGAEAFAVECRKAGISRRAWCDADRLPRHDRRAVCRAVHRRARFRHRLRYDRRQNARRLFPRGSPLRPCGERARMGNACAGTAVVPRGDLFGCLHAASALE
jgi:D-arabinose 1-dehydrogenase-like Zn-dependent alcohol dehydrogenase